MITVYSWNVNGIRAVLRKGFLDWFAHAQPDILCLQEVRAVPGDIPPKLRDAPGYFTYWHPARKKGYSGVGVATRIEPKAVHTLGVKEFDDEGRVQALEFDGFTIVNAYFPNSQPERARIDYKLAFCDAIRVFCDEIRAAGKHVLLCGDFNIAHREIDLARPKQNEDSPGFLPEERERMSAFLDSGYVDTFRHFTPDPGHYTWWSYRARAREKNIGWRIDYHCVDKDLLPRVKEARILADVAGSDHCPITVTLT